MTLSSSTAWKTFAFFFKVSAILVEWVGRDSMYISKFCEIKMIPFQISVGTKTLPNCEQFTDTVQQLQNWNGPPHNARASRHVGCLVKFKGFCFSPQWSRVWACSTDTFWQIEALIQRWRKKQLLQIDREQLPVHLYFDEYMHVHQIN